MGLPVFWYTVLPAGIGRWNADPRTQPYADLIVGAFAREADSANDALRALQQNPTALLRVYVSHNQHATIAHIGIDDQN